MKPKLNARSCIPKTDCYFPENWDQVCTVEELTLIIDWLSAARIWIARDLGFQPKKKAKKK